MKRSDIPDEHVLDLARKWVEGPLSAPGVVQALMDEGVPAKLAVAKVLHMVRRGLMEYGVSPTFAWPVDEAKEDRDAMGEWIPLGRPHDPCGEWCHRIQIPWPENGD